MELKLYAATRMISSGVIFILLLSAEYTLQFEFTLIHTNDVHARFEQFDAGTVKCGLEAEAMSACVGGAARRKTVIKQIRQEVDNVLFLDGGDQFQGTLWFYLYQGEAAAYFMNKLGYDAMAIGNHEFDLGPDKLAEFMKNVDADVVCANIDASREPIDGLFKKSTIKTVGGERFGIVGYLYERTPEISQTRHVRFLNILEEIQREVDSLKAQGVNKIIALGHSGIEKDQEIARKVQGVDIVVGGHTDTFLYTGTPPSTEVPYSNYPIVINPDHDPSAKVLVVQDYTFGKYLGRLDIVFDDEGGITSFDGNPIFLDDSVEQDPEMLAEIQEWAESVSNFSDDVIAKSHVFLDGSRESCRLRECNLGNMIADAYLWSLITFPDEEGWNEVSIAIQNGGGVRASILRGDITIGDVSTVLPFGNTVDYMELQGRYVREMLEVSVEEYDPVELPGKLLQTSGLLVTYDISRKPGDRVREVLVRCSECEVPDYEPLDEDKMYKIVMHSFLAAGRDGFGVIAKHGKNHYTGNMDTAVLSEYLSQHSPIVSGIERRMIILNGTENKCLSWALESSSNIMVPYFLTVLLASLLAILT